MQNKPLSLQFIVGGLAQLATRSIRQTLGDEMAFRHKMQTLVKYMQQNQLFAQQKNLFIRMGFVVLGQERTCSIVHSFFPSDILVSQRSQQQCEEKNIR